MQRWEYTTLTYDPEGGNETRSVLLFSHQDQIQTDLRSVVQVLRELGDQGWELVTSMYAPDHPTQLWSKLPLE